MTSTTHIARTATVFAAALLLVIATTHAHAGGKTAQLVFTQGNDSGQDESDDTSQGADTADEGEAEGTQPEEAEQSNAQTDASDQSEAEETPRRESSSRKLKRDLIELLLASAVDRVRDVIGGDKNADEDDSASDDSGGQFEATSESDPEP